MDEEQRVLLKERADLRQKLLMERTQYDKRLEEIKVELAMAKNIRYKQTMQENRT